MAQHIRVEVPTVTVAPTGVSASGITGAQGAVLVLGAGLAGVALWSDTLKPVLASAWTGEPLAVTMPASGVLSMVLFIGGLVFISDLSSDFAQLAFWFILALWVVYLVMNPGVVQTVASWASQGQQSQQHPTQKAPGSATGGGGTSPS